MEFKLFLEAGNKAQIEVDPSVEPMPTVYAGSNVHKTASPEELKDLALQGVRKYFSSVDPKGFSYLKERYRFIVKKAISDADGLHLRIEIIPLEKRAGEEEFAQEGDPLYSYNMKYKGGKTGFRSYRSPKDAIKEIPNDPSMAYRGISWEEWQHVNRTGFISSRGMYNLGQEGYTLFGKIPGTALSYANGFAPLQYQTSFRKPSVVIAIPRSMTLTHQDDPENIPGSELGVKGKLSKDNIKSAWMLVPTKINTESFLELIFQYTPAWDESKYKDPMTGFYKVDPNHVRIGNGSMLPVASYAIRKLM